jgi:hypothetical protein
LVVVVKYDIERKAFERKKRKRRNEEVNVVVVEILRCPSLCREAVDTYTYTTYCILSILGS